MVIGRGCRLRGSDGCSSRPRAGPRRRQAAPRTAGARADRPDECRRPGAELAALALLALGFARRSHSSSSTPSTGSRTTQLLGLALGLSLAALRGRADRHRQGAVRRRRSSRSEYPPAEHPEEQAASCRPSPRRQRHHPPPPLKLGLGGAGGALGARVRHARSSRSARYSNGSRFSRRRGGAAGVSSTRTVGPTAQATSARRPSTPRSRRAPTGRSSASPIVSCARARGSFDLPPELAGYPAERDRRVLEDLHARRLRDLALPRTALPADEPKPALVCPCHYSTFDPARGGTVIFGPAGRQAPMLPLEIDPRGYLRAAGIQRARRRRRGGASACGGRARDPPQPSAASTSARATRRSRGRRSAISSPTTGRSSSARSRCTRSSSSSRQGSTWRCSSSRLHAAKSSTRGRTGRLQGQHMSEAYRSVRATSRPRSRRAC